MLCDSLDVDDSLARRGLSRSVSTPHYQENILYNKYLCECNNQLVSCSLLNFAFKVVGVSSSHDLGS